MNLFFLHLIASKAAHMHCDKHVNKMILETTQVLSTCATEEIKAKALLQKPESPTGILYKSTHKNHPVCAWCSASGANYRWLLNFGLQLCQEYSRRYLKVHASLAILRWLDTVVPKEFEEFPNAPPVCVMPNVREILLRSESWNKFANTPTTQVVLAYRLFYVMEKSKFAKWTESGLKTDGWGHDISNPRKRVPYSPPSWFSGGLKLLADPNAALDFLIKDWLKDPDAMSVHLFESPVPGFEPKNPPSGRPRRKTKPTTKLFDRDSLTSKINPQ